MLKLMPIPHVLHVKETIPTSRKTNECGGHMFTSGPGIRISHAKSGNMAENHTNTDSIGLQVQVECWYH